PARLRPGPVADRGGDAGSGPLARRPRLSRDRRRPGAVFPRFSDLSPSFALHPTAEGARYLVGRLRRNPRSWGYPQATGWRAGERADMRAEVRAGAMAHQHDPIIDSGEIHPID